MGGWVGGMKLVYEACATGDFKQTKAAQSR